MGSLCTKSAPDDMSSHIHAKSISEPAPGGTSHANFIVSEPTDSSFVISSNGLRKDSVPKPPTEQSPPSVDITHPDSGCIYPSYLPDVGLHLVGVGTRTKFRVRVYAVGVYADKGDFGQSNVEER